MPPITEHTIDWYVKPNKVHEEHSSVNIMSYHLGNLALEFRNTFGVVPIWLQTSNHSLQDFHQQKKATLAVIENSIRQYGLIKYTQDQDNEKWTNLQYGLVNLYSFIENTDFTDRNQVSVVSDKFEDLYESHITHSK